MVLLACRKREGGAPLQPGNQTPPETRVRVGCEAQMTPWHAGRGKGGGDRGYCGGLVDFGPYSGTARFPDLGGQDNRGGLKENIH